MAIPSTVLISLPPFLQLHIQIAILLCQMVGLVALSMIGECYILLVFLSTIKAAEITIIKFVILENHLILR